MPGSKGFRASLSAPCLAPHVLPEKK